MKIGGCISEEVWNRAEAMENALIDFDYTEEGKKLKNDWLKDNTQETLIKYIDGQNKFLKDKGIYK